jgi:hypothetical protein
MQDKYNRLLTLVPWALERLLRQEYEVWYDADGAPQTLHIGPTYGVWSTKEMEEALKTSPLWNSLENLSAQRDHLTPAIVSEALAGMPLPPRWLPREELLHADWSGIITSVFRGHQRFANDFFGATIESRIGLGGPIAAQFEAQMQWLRPGALPVAAADYVIREMSGSFPEIVERLCTFQVTPVTDAVPSTVTQYAREACRCYLQGFFSASLVLCRSCVEAGIETKLDQNGLRKQLNALGFSKVQELLNLAVSSGVLDDLTFRMADEVRRSANKAAHGSVPSEPECRERLEQARAVLRHLYE